MKEFSTFMINFDKLLRNDENLLRLLYYKSNSFSDDIFQITSTRKRITPPPGSTDPSPTDTYVGGIVSNTLRHTLVYSTIKVSDLTLNSTQSCRLLFYLGNRAPSRNSRYPTQEMVVDIYVHTDIDKVDYRLAKLCDYVTELIDEKQIAGIGKASTTGGNAITLNASYIGYRLYFEFGSEKS
jgi:hypothetical protein